MIRVELDIVEWEEAGQLVHHLGTFTYDPTGDEGEFIKNIAERIQTVDAEISIKYSLTLADKYLRRVLTKEFINSAPEFILEKEIKSHLDQCLEEYKKYKV